MQNRVRSIGSSFVYLVVDSQNAYGAMIRTHALALVMAGDEIGEDCQVLHLEITEDAPAIGRTRELTREMGTAWELEQWVSG